MSGTRVSQDIDLFHDTQEALNASWTRDRKTLLEHGFAVDVIRESASFVEASVAKDRDQTTLQWARDSAYRFFPLILHETVGLTMHPFDLATNKVLAMAGRLEVRDWIDVLRCDRELQPLGYLLWAACGKDPGYNPRSLLAATRRQHYSQAEINTLEFGGPAPDAGDLGKRWHGAQDEAELIINVLPAEMVGTCCVAKESLDLFRGDPSELARAVASGSLKYHSGSIGGSVPTIRE